MKKILIAALTAIMCLILFACAPSGGEKQPSAEELLSLALADFNGEGLKTVEGKIFKNGKLDSKIAATFDKKDKRIFFNNGKNDYLYYATYLIKKDGGYVIEKAETDYKETVDRYLPFLIGELVYSEQNRENIYLTDDKIIITFLNKGVKNSFSSSLEISGGVLTLTLLRHEIVSSTLSTTLTENGVSVPLYVRYDYRKGGEIFSELPFVNAADTKDYAVYVLNALAEKYGDTPIKQGVKETEGRINSLLVGNGKITNVSTHTSDGFVTLNIDYNSKEPPYIFGLVPKLQSLEITFDADYNISLLRINGATYKI